jgi:amino acid transporter
MVSDDEVTPAHHHVGIDKKQNDDSISKDPISGIENEYDFDTEEKQVIGEQRQLPDLQRRLRSRHLQMIAIGKSYALQLPE